MARPRKNTRQPSVPIQLGPDGRTWHGYIVVGTRPDGSPDRRHREGRSWEAVAAKIFELEDALAARTVPKLGRMTVERWFTHWLDVIAPVSGRHGEPLDPNTVGGYRSMLRTWVFPAYGRIELAVFDTMHLDEIYAAMKAGREGGKPLMPTSISRNHAILRRGLEVALQRGLVARNVAAQRDNPGSTKARRKKLPSHAEARRVVEVIGKRRNALRWKVGLAIGPRQGEVLAIRWPYVLWSDDAVDIAWQIQRRTWVHGCGDRAGCARKHCRTLRCAAGPRWGHGCADEQQCKGKPAYCPRRREDAPCLRHTRACPEPCPPGCQGHAKDCPSRRGGGLVFTRPKTARGEEEYEDGDEYEDEHVHPVSLPRSLMAELREHEKAQAFEREAAGEAWRDYALVFCTEGGRPIDPADDREDWKSILREAGLREAGTHLMRHIAATMLIDLGVPIEIIQQVLGHTSIHTTRRYIRVSLGLTRRAADAMGAALFGEEPAADDSARSARILHGRARRERLMRRRGVAQN